MEDKTKGENEVFFVEKGNKRRRQKQRAWHRAEKILGEKQKKHEQERGKNEENNF